jgi:hypothetical protein
MIFRVEKSFALQSAMILGAARAALYTPIDTSALLNSQFREIVTDGAVITGRVYSTNYAVYVHDPANPQRFRRSTAKKNSSLLDLKRSALPSMMLCVRSFRYDTHDARAGAKHVRRRRANGRLHGAAADVRRPGDLSKAIMVFRPNGGSNIRTDLGSEYHVLVDVVGAKDKRKDALNAVQRIVDYVQANPWLTSVSATSRTWAQFPRRCSQKKGE